MNSTTIPRKRKKRVELEQNPVHIKRLSTNVKGKKQVEMGPCTLVLGPAGAGKSSVVEAVSLALLGKGHKEGLGKRGVDLLSMMPESDAEMFSEVEFSDGAIASWSCSGTTAKAKQALWDCPKKAEFIFDYGKALLSGDQKKLRDFLVRKLGTETKLAYLKTSIPPSYWETFLSALGSVSNHAVSADQIAGADEQLKTNLKSHKAEFKRLEMLVEPNPLSEQERVELDKLRSFRAETKGIVGQGSQADLEKKKDELERRIAGRKAKALASLEVVKRLEVINKLQDKWVGILKDKPFLTCAACGGEATKERVEQARQKVAAVISEYEDSKAILEAQAQLDKVRSLLDKVSGWTVEDELRLKQLRVREEETQGWPNVLERKVFLSNEIAKLESLRANVADVYRKHLEQDQQTISAAISERLPAGYSAELELRDQHREVCRLMLIKNNIKRELRALSGSETAMLISAFASIKTDDPESIRVLVLDEVWVDRKTIRTLLDAVKNSVQSNGGPSQAIVCCADWYGKTPKSWTVIDFREGS